MLEVKLLGAACLTDERRRVDRLSARRHPMALLALLAAAPSRTLSRGKVVGYLWPEVREKTARNRLTSCLYHVRQALGAGSVATVGDDLRLDGDTVRCDVWAFEESLAAGDHARAVALYSGPFLEGFWLRDAPEFERWSDRERARLRRAYLGAVEELAAQAEKRGESELAARWWRERASEDPYDSRVAARSMAALAAAGNRAEALRVGDAHTRRLKDEFGTEPDHDFQTFVARLTAPPADLDAAPGRADPVDDRAQAWAAAAEPMPRSIAVLPFDALGELGGTAFADGMHGGVLTRLSSISDLRVISRTSVLRYRGAERSLPEIGRELNVGWILEGEVQESPGELLVNVRLVDARADRQAWARDYQRALTAENLFQIQGEITEQIVRSLEAQLPARERERVEERPTRNLDAYRLYVEGRRHLDERTEAGMRRALETFQRAIQHDPDYVPAWVASSDALSLLHDYGYADAEDVLPRAEAAARRALALDPRSAEAHASLGLFNSIRHQGPAAIRELQRAVELRPSYAEAHNWLSWVSCLLGDHRRAMESAVHAVALNPLSPEAVSNLSLSHLINGTAEEALVEARRERELGSSWGTGRFYEGLALYELGRFKEAISVLRDVVAPWAGEGPRATLALAHVASGSLPAAEELLRRIEEIGDSFAAGLVRAAVGQRERAFAIFGPIEHFGHWPTLAVRHLYAPVWEPLRADPRWEVLLRALDRNWGIAADPARPPRSHAPAKSVALLPFDNLSGSSEGDLIAVGLHDDLLTALTRVSALTVISRSSVNRFQDADTPREIAGRELGVGTLVEGSVRVADGRLRLNIRMTDVRSGSHRWAQRYDRELTPAGLFELQSELAREITRALEAELTSAERARVAQQPPATLGAHHLCVQGRTLLDQRTPYEMYRAIEYFQRAIEHERDYALAWSGLADALSLLEFYDYPAPSGTPDAADAAARAVELDHESGQAHASVGIIASIRVRGPQALRALERAVELAPGCTEAHGWLGWLHLLQGQPALALAAARRSVELDPLGPAMRAYLAESHLAVGDAAAALRQASRAREIRPTYGLPHFVEGLVLYHVGRTADAQRLLEHALELVPPWGSPAHPELTALLGVIRARNDDVAGARELLGTVEPGAHPFSRGLILAALGETDAAFAAFGRVRHWKSFSNEQFRYFFPDVLGPLRGDERYLRLLQKIDALWKGDG